MGSPSPAVTSPTANCSSSEQEASAEMVKSAQDLFYSLLGPARLSKQITALQPPQADGLQSGVRGSLWILES